MWTKSLALIAGLAALPIPDDAKPDAAWLASAPSDVDLAVRLRGIEAVRTDLSVFLDAFSKHLGSLAKASLENLTSPILNERGRTILDPDAPVVVLIKLEKDEEAGQGSIVHYGVLFKSNDYNALLQSVTGKPTDSKPDSEGLVSLSDPGGSPIHVLKREGYVGVSNNLAFAKRMAKSDETLEKTLGPEERSRFTADDVGLYVNVAPIVKRNADLLGQFLDRGGPLVESLAGGAVPPGYLASIRGLQTSLVHALEDVNRVVLSIDLDSKGLGVVGVVSRLGEPGPPPAQIAFDETLSSLPSDMSYYLWLGPGLARSFKDYTLGSMFGLVDEKDPDLESVRALVASAKLGQSALGYDAGEAKPNYFTVATYENPENAVKAYKTALAGLEKTPHANAAKIASSKVGMKPETLKGVSFEHASMTFDLGGLARRAQIAVAQYVGPKREILFGAATGSVVTSGSADLPTARKRVEQFLGRNQTLKQSKTYQLVRSKLPAKSDALALVRLQGVCGQLYRFIALINPAEVEGKAFPKLPEDPALIALGFERTFTGARFHAYVPSSVGKTVEIGIFPAFQALAEKKRPMTAQRSNPISSCGLWLT